MYPIPYTIRRWVHLSCTQFVHQPCAANSTCHIWAMGNIYVHVSYLQRAGRPEAAPHLCVCLKLVYIWLVPSHVQLKCPHVWTLCEPYARKYITWCTWLQERMLHCSPSWRLLNIATAKCFGWYFAPLRSTCPAPSRSARPALWHFSLHSYLTTWLGHAQIWVYGIWKMILHSMACIIIL